MNWDLLRPWQRESALHFLRLLHAGQNVLDSSDTGTGKTFSALAAVAELNLPTLALVPKISISSWEHWAGYLGTELDVQNVELIRTGRTPYGTWDNPLPAGMEREEILRCTNCQCVVDLDEYFPCHCHHLGIHCVETKRKRWRYGQWHWNPAIGFLVVDEVHRYNAQHGLNSEMLIAARRQGIPVLALSATPAVSPLDFRALGYVLGLHNNDDFYAWARRHGCRPDPKYNGWKFKVSDGLRKEIMSKIRRELFPARGARTCTLEIPGFPACTISPDLYDIKQPERLNALYTEMAEAIKELNARRTLDAAPDHPLTKILRVRQEVELLKVPVAVELTEDYVAKGNSVALFVNFDATLRELCARLRTRCVIHGKQSAAERQACIDGFQADRERVIVVNTQAGGVSVSLHDVRGEFSRVGLVMPTFSATAFKQVLGRLPREGGKSAAFYRILLAARTVETKVHQALTAKLENLDALCDGDLSPV